MPVTAICLGCLPFLGLVLTIACVRKAAPSPFDALMRGSLVWAFALVTVSNILSALSLLVFPYILLYWLVYLLFFSIRLRRAPAARLAWPQLDRQVCVLAGIALLTLTVALVYPPTTYDSMTYHMPKVAHWWQNGSLEHYYTSIVRQTGLSSFAELVIFHSFVLSGTDYLANLVQWSAFIGIMCMAAATASLLGAGRSGQVLAAFVFATLPMGIAQASGTQTDLVVGFWLSCVAARYIIWRAEAATGNAVYFGMAVGLAVLAKGTAYVISLPFVLAFAFFSIKQYRQLLPRAVLSGLIAMSLCMPHVYRNYAMYGDPIVGAEGTIIFPPTPQSFIVTVFGNMLSNDPLPFTKHSLDQAYEKLLTLLDIDPKNPSLFPFGPISERKHFSTRETYAQNPVHVMLLIWCLSGIGIRRHEAAKRYRRYVIAAVSLFCLLIAWQPWITRLQVPLFALAAPLAGMALETPCRKKVRSVFCVLLTLYCLPVLFWHAPRPLVPVGPHVPELFWNAMPGLDPLPSFRNRTRDELYFAELDLSALRFKPHWRERYFAAVDMLAQADAGAIGLVMGGNAWEYPLWALLRSRVPKMPQVRHVAPPETAEGLPAMPPAFIPQYLFVLDRQLAWEKQDEIKDTPLRLFKRVDGAYARIF